MPQFLPDANRPCEAISVYQIEKAMRNMVKPTRRIETFKGDTDYRYRSSGRAPYLFPAGEWHRRTPKPDCIAIGKKCKWHGNCCSEWCEGGGASGSIGHCFEWHPNPMPARPA